MLWRKKKNAREPKPWERKLYPKIFRQLDRMQRSWAKWMDRRFNGLSLKKKRLLLLSFCLVWVSLLGFLTTEAILKPAFHKKIDSEIKTPKLEMPRPLSGLSLPDAAIERIKRFKSSLDSMGKTEQGLRSRDSLLRSRPGLLDSITEIEEIYQLSKNK